MKIHFHNTKKVLIVWSENIFCVAKPMAQLKLCSTVQFVIKLIITCMDWKLEMLLIKVMQHFSNNNSCMTCHCVSY